MEAYARDEIRLKCQNSIRGVCNDSKVHLTTVDVNTFRNLNINYSLSVMSTTLLGNSGTGHSVYSDGFSHSPEVCHKLFIQSQKVVNIDANCTVTP